MLNEEEERNKKKSLLKSYYNESSSSTTSAKNPLDINSASFDCDLYLSQHIKVNHSFLFLKFKYSSLFLCLRRKS
jgi:hypothetical protein